MKDPQGRNINYIRISVTDKCNLRCAYCMPEEGVPPRGHGDMMTLEEAALAAEAAASLGISKVRITGGEPLVRKGIVDLCRRIAGIPGIDEICITTNGILLPELAVPLRDAGVSRLNISLDTLDPDKYHRITRTGSLEEALAGIQAAKEAGFSPIKINVVLLAGANEAEIPDFVDFARGEGLQVRFIELMPFDEGPAGGSFLSCDAVLRALPGLEPVPGQGGVAEEYQIPGDSVTVGLIRSISCKFCDRCNKIRLTADGKLKPCLHTLEEIPIRGMDLSQVREAMALAINAKPRERDSLGEGHASRAGRSMNQIGG
jgi:cyclic pyranopterin phosphate synthase